MRSWLIRLMGALLIFTLALDYYGIMTGWRLPVYVGDDMGVSK